MNPFIYLRALRHAEHTVFCVEDGQKTYYDAQFGRSVAYSSGQQVKRSILQALTDSLNVQMAPITFNYEITKKKELSNKEPWSPCDPTCLDQLLGGWMRAKNPSVKGNGADEKEKDSSVLKRRSPLSVSAMRPLHPLLAGVDRENLTFDRSDRPDNNPVRVRLEGSDKLLTEEEIEKYLDENNIELSELQDIYISVRDKAYKIIELKKATYYGIGLALKRIVSAILNNEKAILPVSSYQNGEYGREGYFIGTPSVVGSNGIEKVVCLPLNENDQAKFNNSFDTLKKTIDDNLEGII